MKKKFTRKVRKNKRTTQRRKNRSYKRMRGGVYVFKTRGVFSTKQNIPTDVIDEINSSNPNSISDESMQILVDEYKKVIDTSKEEITTFYKYNSDKIKDKIKEFTKETGEDDLTNLPFSTTKDDYFYEIIDLLIRNGFLPNEQEFTRLFTSFQQEKLKPHRNPFKFNGLALAIAIKKISDDYNRIKPPTRSSSSPPPSSSPPSSPDTTNIQQTYLFVFKPSSETSWNYLTEPIAGNSFCHERKRIRMFANTSGKPVPFGLSDGKTATYVMTKLQLGTLISDAISSGLTMSKSLIQGTGETTCTKYHIVDTRSQHQSGEYKFYRIEKRTQNIDFTSIRHNTTICRNKIYIPVEITTVYEHAEDGIINWAFIEYTHRPVVEVSPVPDICRVTDETPSQAVYNEVIVSMENILKLGLNPRVTDIHKIGELEPLIDLMIEIYRGTTPSLGVTADSPIKTLVMISPGKWDIFPATRIQQAAFNKVNQYLIERNITSYDMLQIKRFRVSNNMEGPGEIMVIIEVKEMNPGGTLKRAICMGETLSQFEVLDTSGSAGIRKYNKEVNYNQVTSSGPG